MIKEGRKTAEENKSYCRAWTHIWIPALRGVDLEHSAKRGANRTKALANERLEACILKNLKTVYHTDQPR